MNTQLTDYERYQEERFDAMAGCKRFYNVGGKINRNNEIKIAKIIEGLQLKNKETVLEVGTGEGRHAFKCLEQTPVHFTGIDISQKSLDAAAEYLRPFAGRYTLQKDNANNLSFESNSFDAVYCAATLHHMENPYRMIAEMVRVVKPGNRIAIMEPNWIYPTNICHAILLKEDRNMWIMRSMNFKSWLAKAGLEDITIEHLLYTPPVPRFMIPFYNIFDQVCSRIPIIRSCSLMIFASGAKPAPLKTIE